MDLQSSEPELVSVRLLGRPTLVDAKGRVHALERRDAAMLAVLVMDGPQTRASLAQLLWPDVELPKALSSLRQRLYRLRRLSGHALVAEAGALQLAPGVGHDARPGAWDAAAAEQDLLGGQHYSDGDLLEERVQRLRGVWQRQRADALAQEANRLEEQGDLDGALALAHRLLSLQEASEHAHRRCMRLHYLRGDRSQALAAYAHCADRLMVLVGVTPDQETRRLASLIEASGVPSPLLADSRLQVALSRPPRLVGRQAAWTRMQDAWQRAWPIVLRGEAGIGKTRLATEFAQAWGPVVVVKAAQAEAGAPYALLANLLRRLLPQLPTPAAWAKAELARLVPEWGPVPAHPAEPLRIRQSVAELLTSWVQTQPRALLLDDLQWADAASLEALLAWLTPSGLAAPAVVLCLRNHEVPAPLDTWILAHQGSALLELQLGPLDHAGLCELLLALAPPWLTEAQLDLAAHNLLHQTGGHPFVALELLRAAPDAWRHRRLPATDGHAHELLMTLLGRRLLQLAPTARSLAQLAALAGPSFSVTLATEVLGLAEIDLIAPWRQLIDAQLIQPQGLMFDLVSEAVAQSVPQAIARGLHEKMAASLQARGARPELVASHWWACQQWLPAATAFGLAAQAAQVSGRATEELNHWDQAAHCCVLAGLADQAWAFMRSAVAVALGVEGAQALIKRIDALLSAASSDHQRLDAMLFRARALIDAQATAPALEQAQSALQWAQALQVPQAELDAVAWCGLALALNGRACEGLALLQGHRPSAEPWLHTPEGLNYFGSLGHVHFVQGNYGQALPALFQAAALAEQLGRLGDACEQASNLSTCLNQLGRQAEAVQQGERALQLWRRMGEPRGLTGGTVQTQLAAHYSGAGRFAQALQMLHWAADCFAQTGSLVWQWIAEHRLATVYVRLGQPTRAIQVLSPLPANADAGRRVTRSLTQARIALLRGDFDLALLQQETDHLADQLMPMDRQSLLLFRAAHLPAAQALDLAQQVLQEAGPDSDPAAHVHALARVAQAWADVGQRQQAKKFARLAWAALVKSRPLDISHPAFCCLVHRAAVFGGDPATADQALRSGVQWLEQALPQVPEPYVRSCCERNPDHRYLLSQSSARLVV